MGVVFEATDTVLGRVVAVKFLHAGGLGSEERLLTEARAVASVASDHVVRILDTGRDPAGQLFVVMERLDGEDLAARLRQRGLFDPSEAVWCVLQAAEALAHAHAAGFVHRDIKPSNLFAARRPDGREVVKVLDFGIAKVLDAAGPTLTGVDMLGTPYFMSPEQLRNAKDVDARADVWSLGITLFQLLSGRTPWRGRSHVETIAAIFESPAPTMTSLGVSLPPGLEATLLRALVRDRDNRVANMYDLASSLAPYTPNAGALVETIGRVLGGAVTRAAADPDHSMHGAVTESLKALLAARPLTAEEEDAPPTEADGPVAWDSVTVKTVPDVPPEGNTPRVNLAATLKMAVNDGALHDAGGAPSTQSAGAPVTLQSAPDLGPPGAPLAQASQPPNAPPPLAKPMLARTLESAVPTKAQIDAYLAERGQSVSDGDVDSRATMMTRSPPERRASPLRWALPLALFFVLVVAAVVWVTLKR